MSWLFHDKSTPPFDAAIALGNVVGGNIPPDARDSRVLSILLILRELSSSCPTGSKKYEGRLGMHVVVENCVDQTALLAVCPKRTVHRKVELDNDNEDNSDGNTIGSTGEAELAGLRASVDSSASKEMRALVETWAPKPCIIEESKLEEEVKRVTALLSGSSVDADSNSK
jgi:hypothetical protein